MMEFGLLISMAVSNSPSVSLADWEKNDDSNPLPDLMLGGHNDWWLKTNDDGDLYVQCRYHDLGQGDLAERAWRVMGVLDKIEDRWGNVILMPWTPIAIDVALGAWIRKENAVKESVRESRKRAEEEAKREQEWIRQSWTTLSHAMGDCLEGLTLPQAVSLLVSQRENARNATVATKLIMEKVLKRCLPYIPKDGTQERDLREAIEDVIS